MIKLFKEPGQVGVFILEGRDVTYVGKNKDGLWYWEFSLYPGDEPNDDFFNNIMGNVLYETSGTSGAYYDTFSDLKKDIVYIKPYVENILKLLEMIDDDETVAAYGYIGSVPFDRVCLAIAKTDSDDISGMLEDTLYRLLDNSADEDEVYRIMGAEQEDLTDDEDQIIIDLGYCIPGQITCWNVLDIFGNDKEEV